MLPIQAIIFYFILFLSTILSIVTYKTYRNTPNRYFLWFLCLTFLVELIGVIRYYYYYNFEVSQYDGLRPFITSLISDGYISNKYIRKITWMYNSYRIITFPFYIFYYSLLVKSKKKKKQINYVFIFCIAIIFIDVIVNRDVFISEKLMLTRIVGGVLILISSAIYLMEVLKSDELLTFHKTLPFWITFGALIFYLTTIPIFLFKDYLYNTKTYTYTIILNISNYFLYGCFIIGFIVNAVQHKKNKAQLI